MKKHLSLLLALVLLTGLLSACGRLPPSPTESPSRPDAPSPIPTDVPLPAESPAAPTPSPSPETPDYDPEALHPMLWKVSDGEGHSLYLFGTIHVGDGRSGAVLEKLLPLLRSCDALAVEFDAVAYQKDLGAVLADYQQFLYADGSSVRDHMPQELYERCAALLTEAGAYSPLLDHYNLGMWSSLVESAALMTQSPLQAESAMDLLLIRWANDHALPVLELESAAFQMALLNSFSDELNLLMIRSALDHLDSYGESITALYEAWLEGDYEQFLSLFLDEEGEEELTGEERALVEDYNKSMVDERNLGMAKLAADYLAGGDTVFLAAGAGHMVGDAGLVRLLQDAGFTVERVEY